jgi:hypothetical protein
MVRAVLLTWLGAILVSATTACTTRLKASTTEPNPMTFARQPSEPALSSRLLIPTRDMEFSSHDWMTNTAYFSVVSRDRLRFHVTLQHKWKEVTDIKSWDVHLEDDRGHVYEPESTEEKNNKHKSRIYDYERRTVLPPQYPNSPELVEGQTISQDYATRQGIPNDGWKERVPLASVDTFKGQGDYVFHARDIFSPTTKRVTLVMKRDGLEYRFTWNFQ